MYLFSIFYDTIFTSLGEMTMSFIETIKNLTEPTLAMIKTETEVKMNKKDVETKKEANPYLGAKKKSTLLVVLNPKYEKAVNDQREAEGKDTDFEATSRKWGTNIGNGIVDNNGKLYVSYILKESKDTEYFFDEMPIAKSLLSPYIPKAKPNTNQGVDESVKFMTIALENIKEMEIL